MARSKTYACLVGLNIVALAMPAHAFHGGGGGFHGGGGGGGGFHGGGGGGFRGGGMVGGGYGGGFRGGEVGGFGGYRGGYGAQSFNRTPSFTPPHTVSGMPRNDFGNVNRMGNVNNFNRPNAFNNNNVGRFNAVNNGNRINNINNFNNTNINRMGVGWHNPYVGYHQGWNHGYWNGNFGGGWGWRPWGYGYGLGGFGYGLGWGLGMGAGWGLSSWMFGPMLYNWGYSGYYNPYYAGGAGGLPAQSIIYDYSQPIDPQATPPDDTVASQANTVFDSARDAFKAGDYSRALDLTDQALKSTPNDAALHEFRALCLFALKRYEDAAGVLYAVLSVGPGWDWTTLISLYADPEVYTQQLRALENYCSQNPQSAAGRFVLAYHYLTEGHAEAAVRQLKYVSSLQPKDQLTVQLIQQIQRSDQTTQAADATPAQAPIGDSTTPLTTPVANTANAGKLEGTWTAQPNADTAISVIFTDPGHFTWKVTRSGKSQEFSGTSTFENGILTLVQSQNSNAMVGNVTWTDPTHFTFKVVGGGPNDPGLSFAQSGS
jgi:hypothetical protein